jgi:hypothetical protein
VDVCGSSKELRIPLDVVFLIVLILHSGSQGGSNVGLAVADFIPGALSLH